MELTGLELATSRTKSEHLIDWANLTDYSSVDDDDEADLDVDNDDDDDSMTSDDDNDDSAAGIGTDGYKSIVCLYSF